MFLYSELHPLQTEFSPRNLAVALVEIGFVSLDIHGFVSTWFCSILSYLCVTPLKFNMLNPKNEGVCKMICFLQTG